MDVEVGEIIVRNNSDGTIYISSRSFEQKLSRGEARVLGLALMEAADE